MTGLHSVPPDIGQGGVYEPLKGLFLFAAVAMKDSRGIFMQLQRFDDSSELPSVNLRQVNLAVTQQRGTVRGLHFQDITTSEHKRVQCVRGAVFDVALDVRPTSPTLGQWFGTELSAHNNHVMWLSPGFAHGVQALQDDSAVLYLHSADYEPTLEFGINPLDTGLGIAWPLSPHSLSERDLKLPTLQEFLQ